jgi:translation initiation factor 1
MDNICPKCGLPSDLCVCETIAKEALKIRVKVVKKRYGKLSTVIEGVTKEVNIKDLAKTLKSSLACGGTVKDNIIELQGDHTKKVKEILINKGFSPDQIEIK